MKKFQHTWIMAKDPLNSFILKIKKQKKNLADDCLTRKQQWRQALQLIWPNFNQHMNCWWKKSHAFWRDRKVPSSFHCIWCPLCKKEFFHDANGENSPFATAYKTGFGYLLLLPTTRVSASFAWWHIIWQPQGLIGFLPPWIKHPRFARWISKADFIEHVL